MTDKAASWSLYEIWNESLEQKEERPMTVRDHIWASELGGSPLDRYLKMNAIPPSNPFTARSLRKFEAGNIWEWIIGLVLKRAGILLDNQQWFEYQYPGLCRVSGKFDYYAGGIPSLTKAEESLSDLQLPQFITRATENIVKHFQEKYPNGLKQVVVEVKSCSSFIYEKMEKTKRPERKNALQLFHYLKAKGEAEGHIFYINKDDARIMEFVVWNPSEWEDEYKADIEKISKYIQAKQEPPLEKPLEWDELAECFRVNWFVTYSSYLTMKYGYKDQAAFEDQYRPVVAQWNRVLERILNDDKMTNLNLEVIDAITKDFPDFPEIINKLKQKREVTNGRISNG